MTSKSKLPFLRKHSLSQYTAIADSTSTSHSSTNLMTENVDEADIVKTDGTYISSFSYKDGAINEYQQTLRVLTTNSVFTEDGIRNTNTLRIFDHSLQELGKIDAITFFYLFLRSIPF